jgi:cold shock CspA family protein
MRGEMPWFNGKKDHGFIRTDEGERLRVDGSGFAASERPEGRCAEKVVTFQIEENGDERPAQNAVFEREVVGRRARLSVGGRRTLKRERKQARREAGRNGDRSQPDAADDGER